MDAKTDRQKEDVGVRTEMLPKDPKNQLAGHDTERRHQEKDIRRKGP